VLSADETVAVLFAGRHESGELDFPETRALAERMLAEITSEPTLEPADAG
jgi:hypothetical protein